MTRVLLLIPSVLLATFFGITSCSSPSEEPPMPTPHTSRPFATDTIKAGEDTLKRIPSYGLNLGMGMPEHTFSDKRQMIIDYAISKYWKADTVYLYEVSPMSQQKGISFFGHDRLGATSISDEAAINHYRNLYGDRKDSLDPYQVNSLIVNIDSIRIMQRDGVSGLLKDVSSDYALVYYDCYNFVNTPPRRAYYYHDISNEYFKKSHGVNEAYVRRRIISDCDSLLCRWAFNTNVPPHIKPLPQAKPNRNTLLILTLTGGKKLIVPWEK